MVDHNRGTRSAKLELEVSGGRCLDTVSLNDNLHDRTRLLEGHERRLVLTGKFLSPPATFHDTGKSSSVSR